MLIPDNHRTGVDHSDWYTPKINKTYHEMAEHYGTAPYELSQWKQAIIQFNYHV